MDRVAKLLVRNAGPGPWVEAGDGALAIAVAMQAALRGASLEVFLSEDVTLEVRQTLMTYRAKVTLTPFAEGKAGAVRRGRALGPLLSDLFPHARVEAMEQIGRELLASEEQIDAFVAPLGTGATLSAVGRVLRSKFPAVKLVAVKPFAGQWKPHRQAGVFPEPLAAPAEVGFTERVDDLSAWKMRTRLGTDEGLLVSVGAAAGVEAACRVAIGLGPGARIVALASDTGERDFSLAEQF
jgi:cysteine synthase A